MSDNNTSRQKQQQQQRQQQQRPSHFNNKSSFDTPLHEYFYRLLLKSRTTTSNEFFVDAEIFTDNCKRHSRSVRRKAIMASDEAEEAKRKQRRMKQTPSKCSKRKQQQTKGSSKNKKGGAATTSFNESFGEDYDWTYDGTDDTIVTSSSQTVYPFLPPTSPTSSTPRIFMASISSESIEEKVHTKSPLRHSVSSSSFLSPTPPTRCLSPVISKSSSFLSPSTKQDALLDISLSFATPNQSIECTPTQRRRNTTLSSRSFQNPSPTCVVDDIYNGPNFDSPARPKKAITSRKELLIMSPRSARWSSKSPRILKTSPSNSIPSAMNSVTSSKDKNKNKVDDKLLQQHNVTSNHCDWQEFQSSPGVEWNSPSASSRSSSSSTESSSSSSRKLSQLPKLPLPTFYSKLSHNARTNHQSNEQHWVNLPPLLSPRSISKSSVTISINDDSDDDDPNCMPPLHPKRKLSLTDQFNMLDLLKGKRKLENET